MNRTIGSKAYATLATILLAASFSLAGQAAEKREQTF
jgi:hypothetical protein